MITAIPIMILIAQFIVSMHLYRELRDSYLLAIKVHIHCTTGYTVELAYKMVGHSSLGV